MQQLPLCSDAMQQSLAAVLQLCAAIPRPVTNPRTMGVLHLRWLPCGSLCRAATATQQSPVCSDSVTALQRSPACSDCYAAVSRCCAAALRSHPSSRYQSTDYGGAAPAVVILWLVHGTGLAHGAHCEGCAQLAGGSLCAVCRLLTYTSPVPAPCVVAGGLVVGPCLEDALRSSGCWLSTGCPAAIRP